MSIHQLGQVVRVFREEKGLTQGGLAEQLTPPTNRTAIAHLEQGRRIPEPDVLTRICQFLAIPRTYWAGYLDRDAIRVGEFEGVLSELVGLPLTIDELDSATRATAQGEIIGLLDHDFTTDQTYDAFRSLLVYYGIPPIGRALFARYFDADTFRSMEAFRRAVASYQKDCIRLFSTFEDAYSKLAAAPDLAVHLDALARKSDESYRARAEWHRITDIPEERLPDLGYIAAARVRQESVERSAVSKFLKDLAVSIRSEGPVALDNVGEKKRRKMDSLLRKFDPASRHSLFSKLFLPDPDQLERKADQIGPKDEGDLDRMASTQEQAQRNLSNYLSADYLDVYVATSMRSDADFVSVNRFVRSLFAHDAVRPLKLRYFNPTQSWIDDRVAKGLVEALMLKRASITIYMAQKDDTFGKDSEASVALGQGKPVIVYVPKLEVPELDIDTERLWRSPRSQLEQAITTEGHDEEQDFDETVDQEALLGRLLSIRLSRASPTQLADVVAKHWADFDLYGEDSRIEKPEQKAAYRAWLDQVTKKGDHAALSDELKEPLLSILVATALRFERRAKIFREVHPLALQVILSSGVLNGILVARSVQSCAELLRALVRNDLQLELRVDELNYRLVETTTDSTVRVISKHRLLRNAFAAFYSLNPKGA